MKVIDLDSGEEKGVGETGELCFDGPQVMPGYFNNEKATAETLIDGWIHTGDIGHYDENGSVYIVDRKKELIKVKGLQVCFVLISSCKNLLTFHSKGSSSRIRKYNPWNSRSC